jgi:hypothetical protein
VNARLFEQPAVEHGHDAAAAVSAGMILSVPIFAGETTGRLPAARLVLEPFEFSAEAVTQGFEPGARLALSFFQSVSHRSTLAKVGNKDKAICRHSFDFSQ